MTQLAFSGLKIIIFILGLTCHICCAAKVSETPCTDNAQCTVGHSECDTTMSMCKCSDTYTESTPDGTSCDPNAVQSQTTKVSETHCTDNAQCTVGHSECDTTTSMCKCSDTYTESTPDGTSCDPNAVQPQTSKVSETDCNDDSACKVQHSECDSTQSKCKCSDNYVESSPAGTSCVAAPAKQVSTVTCSSTGTECSAIPFSVCAINKCKCKDGYKEGPNGGSACVKVLGTHCTGSDPCPGTTSSVCAGSKCTCSTGYGEKDNVCKKLLNTVTCQANGHECDTNEHTECDTVKGTCKCAAGFTMNVDVCTAKNTGATITMNLGIIAIPVVLAVLEAVKNLK